MLTVKQPWASAFFKVDEADDVDIDDVDIDDVDDVDDADDADSSDMVVIVAFTGTYARFLLEEGSIE